MDLLAPPERARELARSSHVWPSITLTPAQVLDVEMLLNGSLCPLTGFMSEAACDECAGRMRLPDGTFWPLPITLDVEAAAAEQLPPGSPVVLRESEGSALAVLHLDERWPTPATDGGAVPRWRLAGRVEGLTLPRHYDFRDIRRTPAEVKAAIVRRGWPAAMAVQTDRLLHRAAIDRVSQVARGLGAGVVLQAIIAPAGPADERHYSRIRSYRAAAAAVPDSNALLALLPWRREAAGPRAVALGAVIARNYGCTHVATNAAELHAALDAAGADVTELAIAPVDLPDTAPPDAAVAAMLDAGELPPDFTFPGVSDELPTMFPSPSARGVTVFFTGLSGSGKSTIANALRVLLLERGGRRVTLLDGDLVRQHLSSELGFSREHRELNIKRIGFVAAEITKHGGIAICAPIAPYNATRRAVRRAVEAVGAFVLVYVDTPLAECERRDPKGLYARARAGTIPAFTGVSDPYEAPSDAELVIRTTAMDVETAAARVAEFLERAGYLAASRR